MSHINIANLPRISASALSSRLLSSQGSASIAVVDVRDNDHIGGHIKGALHVPSATIDYRVPELVRILQDKDTVVFHCMLSQQRGPSAALRYARERERLLGNDKGKCLAQDEEGAGQKVCVLERGFGGWQEKYVNYGDTEGYTTPVQGTNSPPN